ncbi:MAG: hypothetical protein Q4A18_01195 [Rikenellaceae bacterium]|nr:hypothetical protein [Rikenellaceae bacterium]
MKKIATTLLLLATVATSAMAGGPMTNSNQSAAFLRSIARGTTLDTDAVYNNPAGTAFMADGWHFGINDQMAKQTRKTESYSKHGDIYPGGFGLTEYEGEVFSPLIPSFHLTWKKNRWAVMLGMGVNGGGGEIEYNNGLASFERMFSILPTTVQALGINASGYSSDMYLKGKSQTLAFNLGASFRITDWLSAAALVRFSTTSNAYEGYLKNTNLIVGGQAMPATGIFNQAYQNLKAQYDAAIGAYGEAFLQTPTGQQLVEAMTQVGTGAVKTADHILDVEQTGTSISPILALYAQKNGWAFAVKYEFKMATELEIKSAPISANDPVINEIFPNGSKVKAETPALLSVAGSRQCGPVKVTAEWHMYFDKDAENSFSSCIEGNTMEYLLGAEWQISKKWLVSCGVQRTQLDMNENAYSDMNFSTSSWSTGIGAAYSFSEKIRLNLGIMPTFYEDVTSRGEVYNNETLIGYYKDIYSRTSLAWGLGLDFKF